MPISEDEYDPCTTYEASSTMSKAELRKTHKPIMEKKRRARINHCLNEIKTLILDALKKDPARHSKLEKADILEMAVKHLQNVQRQQLALAMASDPSVLRKFKAGFNECAEEVKRYVGGLEGLEAGVQQRISSHLSKCISGIEQIVHLNFPGFGGIPFLTSASSILTSKLSETAESSDDQNNNPSIQIPHSLQVIPSRLPTGELALLLPNSNSLPYFSSVAQNNQFNQNSSLQENKRLSAFVTVIPSSVTSTISSPNKTRARPPSPPQSPSSSSILRPEQEQMISVPQIRKTPSPHGFRPVHPNQHSRIQISSLYKHPTNNLHLDPQQIVTSTSSTDCDVRSIPKTTIQSEVKSICFPIQKLSEPLSIITNQSERYKFAQTPEESIKYEENIQRGVKRKFECVQPGLITVLPQKVLKTCHDSSVVDFKIIDDNQRYNELFLKNVQLPSTSQGREEHPESNADMWRPW